MGGKLSPYAWTKASNTELIVNYAEWYDISYAITYFYNVYGGREISKGKYATLIAIYKECMKNKLPLNVVRPGNQKRNFTYIEDIISGLILVGKKGDGDGFGIGNPNSYSVIEIAQMFGGDIDFLPERPGNRMSAQLVSRKTEQLGWKAYVEITEYISKLKQNDYS